MLISDPYKPQNQQTFNGSSYWQAFSENFTGLELEDGGGRGTSGFVPPFLCDLSFSFSSQSLTSSCTLSWP